MPSLVLVIAPRLLAVFLILTLLVRSPAQQPTPLQPSGTPTPPAAGQLPPGHPPTAQEPATGPAANAAPAGSAPTGSAPTGNAPDGQDPGAAEAAKDGKAKTPPRRGIPVDDLLVHTHCARCHALDDKSLMTRISFVRKSPEGWAESLKRMIRLHGLQVAPADAKQLVRSLANSHGLARSEAERGLYESERRVHWSEEQQDQDFRRACAECHPLGRVLLQQRDDEEWQLLRATHVAMFPLARGQMGGGPPEDESRRFGGGGPPPGAAATGGGGAGGGGGNRRGGGGDGNQGGPTQSVGDRVLGKLAKDQPLFSPAWEKWTKNRREVPLAGTWTVVGHETGRGDLRGTVDLRRTDADEYDVVWNLSWSDGTTLVRQGKGLLYAGYSWRGRSTDPGEKGATWREVLLLDETWQTFRGRLFTGTHDELGTDVSLFRHQQRPRVLALGKAAVEVPATSQVLEVFGEAFPATVQTGDLFVGQGVTIQAVERVSERLLRVTLDTAAGTELGPRTIAFGSEPGSVQLQLYDTIDYVRITPLQGLSRIGGAKLPRQLERFEAFAVHRGPDGKPYTEDDVDLFQVRPRWALEEFRVRDGDDDLQFVGSIDAASGLFTPNVDGPNPARKWSANNVGDVFVTVTVELDVAVRPEPKPAPEPKAGDDGKQAPAGAKPAAGTEPAAAKEPKTAPAATPPNPPAREQKTFRARSHLIVTVPLYSRWQSLDWEDR